MKTKNWLSTNEKLARDNILSWGIPAYRSLTGKLTCPGAKDCIVGCYAKNGRYVMPNVKAAQEARLALSLTDEFVFTIHAEIQRRKPSVIRIHDSGDFYSAKYLCKWIHIMELNPEVKFYAYTKMIPLFQSFISIPKNFTGIYSFGGKFDEKIDTRRDRHSVVFESKEAMTKAGYVDTTVSDINAIGPVRKIGLVYHGPKAKAWQSEKVSA